MNLTLVGSGNVAFVFSKLLVAAGHSIEEVVGRNTEAVSLISHSTGAKVKFNLSDLSGKSDIIVIAVSDAVIADVASQIHPSNSLVVHTSGATSIEVLKRFKRRGVLYPLQSLRKETKDLPPIPFFIDANNGSDIELLQHLVLSTYNKVTVANDAERLKYHVAAVFTSNFTNHLYTLAQYFCNAEKMAFENLLPLIDETARRLNYYPAAQMQTGPAIRHDETTIDKHLQILQSYPALAEVYRSLTQSIQQFQGQPK